MKFSLFNTSLSILNKILNDDIAFRVAIDQECRKHKIEASTRSLIAATIGAELRHHLLFTYLVDKNFLERSNEEKLGLYLLLGNNLFSKKMVEEEALSSFKDYLVSIKSDLSLEEVKTFLKKHNDPSSLIGEEIDRGSLKFLSLRYNTPVWLIKMWQKHFGKGLTIKILNANTKLPYSVLRVNTLKVDSESLLSKYEKFSKAKLDDTLFYIGKESLNKQEEYQNFEIFPTSLALKYLLDSLEINPYGNVAIYQGVYGENLFLEVAQKMGKEMECELLFKSAKDYMHLETNHEKYGLSKTTYSQMKGDFVTHISKKVNAFFLYSESSSFQNIRTSPDYLLHFKQDSLDDIIQREKSLLEMVKDYIEDEGKLIYIVNTLSKKESVNIIKEFLENNKDFSLLDQKQFLPFDDYNSTLYYAVLKKEVTPSD